MFLDSTKTASKILKLVGTAPLGPLSACALGFATALCRSNEGCEYVGQQLQDSDWQHLLSLALSPLAEFRYQDVVLNFFSVATLSNGESQMRLGKALVASLRQMALHKSSSPLVNSLPPFMRAVCNRLLLADSEIAFYCLPDFDDSSTFVTDTDVVPFAGFPSTCLFAFVPPPFTAAVRMSGPGRCAMLDLMTRSKRHSQLASANIANAESDDASASKAAKMLKIASTRRKHLKDAEGDVAEDMKSLNSLNDLCNKFAQEGGLERDTVSASIAWRPPARWLIKKFFYAPRRPVSVPISLNRNVRSILGDKTQKDEESLSAFFSSPLVELSGFAALPPVSSSSSLNVANSSASTSQVSNAENVQQQVPHILR